MRELMGLLSEPDLSDGLLVHAGFHLRLPGGESEADVPDPLAGNDEVPPACSDFFLTVDFGNAQAYRRQILVVFEPRSAAISIKSDDKAWMDEVARRVETFVGERRVWFRSHHVLQRSLLIAGMAAVTLSASLSLLAPASLRWAALWLFLAGIAGVVASYVLPRLLPHSLVRLDARHEPLPTVRERLAIGFTVLAFSVTFVGFGVALLLALTGD